MAADLDVVVVGGGPAGAVAAAEAARRGCRVAVVDRARRIGTPVRCGELIRTTSLRDFAEVRAPWVVARVDAYRIVGPGGASMTFPEPGMGCLLDRRAFDQHLIEQAAAAGADVLTETMALDVVRRGSSIAGVRTDRGELRASIVIAADGVASRIGRLAGFPTTLTMTRCASTAFGIAESASLPEGTCELHFGRETAPGGYAWLFARGDGTANVGVGARASMLRGRTAADLLHAFVTRRCPRAALRDVRAGGIPMTLPLRPLASEGMMLVGDAARQVNPITGAGIHTAMLAGRICGEVAAAAVAKGDVSARTLRTYEQRWYKTCGELHRSSWDARKRLDRMTDRDLDRAIDRLGPRGHAASVAGAIAAIATDVWSRVA